MSDTMTRTSPAVGPVWAAPAAGPVWTAPAAVAGPVLGVAGQPVAALRPTVPARRGVACGGATAPVEGTGLSPATRVRGSSAAGSSGSVTTGAAVLAGIEQLSTTIPGEQPPGDPLG